MASPSSEGVMDDDELGDGAFQRQNSSRNFKFRRNKNIGRVKPKATIHSDSLSCITEQGSSLLRVRKSQQDPVVGLKFTSHTDLKYNGSVPVVGLSPDDAHADVYQGSSATHSQASAEVNNTCLPVSVPGLQRRPSESDPVLDTRQQSTNVYNTRGLLSAVKESSVDDGLDSAVECVEVDHMIQAESRATRFSESFPKLSDVASIAPTQETKPDDQTDVSDASTLSSQAGGPVLPGVDSTQLGGDYKDSTFALSEHPHGLATLAKESELGVQQEAAGTRESIEGSQVKGTHSLDKRENASHAAASTAVIVVPANGFQDLVGETDPGMINVQETVEESKDSHRTASDRDTIAVDNNQRVQCATSQEEMDITQAPAAETDPSVLLICPAMDGAITDGNIPVTDLDDCEELLCASNRQTYDMENGADDHVQCVSVSLDHEDVSLSDRDTAIGHEDPLRYDTILNITEDDLKCDDTVASHYEVLKIKGDIREKGIETLADAGIHFSEHEDVMVGANAPHMDDNASLSDVFLDSGMHESNNLMVTDLDADIDLDPPIEGVRQARRQEWSHDGVTIEKLPNLFEDPIESSPEPPDTKVLSPSDASPSPTVKKAKFSVGSTVHKTRSKLSRKGSSAKENVHKSKKDADSEAQKSPTKSMDITTTGVGFRLSSLRSDKKSRKSRKHKGSATKDPVVPDVSYSMDKDKRKSPMFIAVDGLVKIIPTK